IGIPGSPFADRSGQPAQAVPAPRRRRPSRRIVLTAAMPAAAAVVGLTALTALRPASLGAPAGDEELAAALAPHLGGHRRVAAILVEDGQSRLAGFGTGEGRSEERRVGKECRSGGSPEHEKRQGTGWCTGGRIASARAGSQAA